MSLRWRLMGAFMSIVLLTVILSISIAAWSSYSGVSELNAAISQDEAQFLADQLGAQYAATGDFRDFDETLAFFGYPVIGSDFAFPADAVVVEEFPEAFVEESTGDAVIVMPEDVPFDDELFFPPGSAIETWVTSRVVVLDENKNVLLDNYDELQPGEAASTDLGQMVEITDQVTAEVVGFVLVDTNIAGLEDGSNDFLLSMLYNTIAGGLITAVITMLLAYWFSNRITAPVIALTHATEKVSDQATPQPLPVQSDDELGQMTTSFNQMIANLQTQRELRKRLVSDLSHELNTPLSVIQLEAQALGDGLQTPDIAAVRIKDEINLLENLVYDLNWLAEADANAMRIDPQPVSVQSFLTAEVQRWQSQTTAKGVSLYLQGDVPNVSVELDRLRMSQVLGNVLRNACQHTPQGGRIGVRTEITPTTIEILVQDSGAGIAADDIPHLFERFYQVDQVRNRDSGGSGLGLAIAKAIVEAHNGTITIDSLGLGYGSTVTICLPRNK